jgi:HAD superfamily hydrolase (TIGR01484 family)
LLVGRRAAYTHNMKSLSEFTSSKISILFTDIDDTLTNEGRLGAPAYHALWRLHENGFRVIPVTGRPAGWCEMIARLWPVDGVIGENGGVFILKHNKKKKSHNFKKKQ